MSKFIKNGVFNHQKWQRDLNEGPGDDPILKSLRTVAPGEEFPETSKWWIYEPRDIMTYIYWHQGKMPPEGAAYDKEWKSVVRQLHAKYPIPAELLPKANLDRDTMDAIMHDVPRAESVDRATMTEALARGLKPLLMIGSTIKSNVGEDALVKLSDKFEDIDDEQADDIASHLNMGIELMQDRSPSEARGWFKKFNNACKDALKGKPTKSAFENNDPAVRFKKLAGMTEASPYKPGDYKLGKTFSAHKRSSVFPEWEMSFASMILGGVKLDPSIVYKVKARTTVEAIKKASKDAGLSGNDWMATITNTLVRIK